MDSKFKKMAAGIALAGALAVGTAGAAFAADGSGTASTTAPSSQAAKAHPRLRAAVRRGTVKVVTDTLGVSRQDLRTALKSGQTLSQYTTSLNKDPQTVVDALTKAANDKIDQLVANGTLKSDRAATIKEKLPSRIDKLMNHQFGQHANT
jgi:ribosomal protein S20